MTDSPKGKKNSRDGQEPENPLRKLGLFAVIVGDMLGYTAAGGAISYFAWSKWGAPWWVLILGTSLGLVLAFYKIYLIGRKER